MAQIDIFGEEVSSPRSEEELKGIFLGDRSESFKTLVESVLNLGNLEEKYMKRLLKKMEMFGDAFTSQQVDPENNYQFYEQIGDLSANKFIVGYIYKRFPQLRTADGVKVAARLRINYGSKNSFCKIAEDLNFWDFISATNELRHRKKKSLLEDVFEAFLGVTETIIAEKYGEGAGYECVYKILKGIFDKIDISLKYEDLYDAKTRLKELFDMCEEKLGLLVYEETKNSENTLTTSTAYRLDGAKHENRPDGTINTKKIVGSYKKVFLGKGTASLKADAQQIAAGKAIETLAKQGYKKFAPKIYAQFSGDYKKDDITQDEILKEIKKADPEGNINAQVATRGKSKYQAKYTSTMLGKFCIEKDYNGIKIALELGADPNSQDSEGLSCTDLLLIGKSTEENQQIICKTLKRFLKQVKKLEMHKNVHQTYFSVLSHDWFKNVLSKIVFLDK